MNDSVTQKQIRNIFRLGKERGLDINGLRSMTPQSSISKLSRHEAANLIDALQHGRSPDYSKRSTPQRPRRPRPAAGAIRLASDAQRNLVNTLRIEIGWTPEGFRAWLGERHFADGRPMTDIKTSTDAHDVIELMKHVRDKQRHGERQNGRNATSASA